MLPIFCPINSILIKNILFIYSKVISCTPAFHAYDRGMREVTSAKIIPKFVQNIVTMCVSKRTPLVLYVTQNVMSFSSFSLRKQDTPSFIENEVGGLRTSPYKSL